ncbi:hypothetical protein D3C84_939400 [compost metagenome]
MIFILQLLVRQRRADAAADDQQGDDRHRQTQLQMIVFSRLGQQAAGGQHQIEGGHAGEVHAEDACAEYQAGAVLERLMEHAAAVAQVARQ